MNHSLVTVGALALLLGGTQAANAEKLVDFGVPTTNASPTASSTVQSVTTASVEIEQAPVQGASAETSPKGQRAIASASTQDIALSFSLPTSQPADSSPEASPTTPETSATAPSSAATLTRAAASPSLDTLFEGGANSLVARAIGSAEGTRTPDGGKTPAYYGHVDPGNRVWNLGSFSYQHAARSPEDADEKQLQRLESQAEQLRQKATDQGVRLTLEAELNGLDLANQAPLAALGRSGYIDCLNQAYQRGLKGSDAVLWARTRSFLNPDTQQWDAPGLGNTTASISHDQERRLNAVASAIDVPMPVPAPKLAKGAPAASEQAENRPPDREQLADRIIQQNVSVNPQKAVPAALSLDQEQQSQDRPSAATAIASAPGVERSATAPSRTTAQMTNSSEQP